MNRDFTLDREPPPVPVATREILGDLPAYTITDFSAGFGRGKEVRQRGIECSRLFSRYVVSGTWNHQQARRRRGTLEIDAAVDAGLVFIADNDEQWD